MRLFNAILIGIVQIIIVLVKKKIIKTFVDYSVGYCSKLYMLLLNSQSNYYSVVILILHIKKPDVRT